MPPAWLMVPNRAISGPFRALIYSKFTVIAQDQLVWRGMGPLRARGCIALRKNWASSVMNMLLLVVFPLAMIFGALWDLTTMTIPNLLSIALVAMFALLVPFVGLALQDIALHVAAGLVMLALGMGLFALGWIGGGDAKFVSAIALWIGWSELLGYLLLASIFGGVLTLLLLGFRKMPLPSFMHREWLLRLHDRKSGIPYGVALAAAALVMFERTVWFKFAAHAA